MKKIDLLGRFKRTLLCKKKHWAQACLVKMGPDRFYKCPYFYSSLFYMTVFGQWPTLRHPKDVNQLLMKLNIDALTDDQQKSLRIQCADKWRVREYVESKGLKDILVPLYGAYDSFDEIDFDQLPNQFVIKTNYACGQNLICKDKTTMDWNQWSKRFDDWMAMTDFGLASAEWHYSHIKHKIVMEKYLESLASESMEDYKFHCFNGQVFGCLIVYDRDKSAHGYSLKHYDTDWKEKPYIDPLHIGTNRPFAKPKDYDRMVAIARTLSEGFPYCRVDLYAVKDGIRFGELTFTPAANAMTYYTKDAKCEMLNFYYATLNNNECNCWNIK